MGNELSLLPDTVIDEEKIDTTILTLFAGINHNITTSEAMLSLEKSELEKEQAPTPVRHIFGAGVYIRELSAAAGTFLIGHSQKMDHMNVMVKGKVLMLKDDGSIGIVGAGTTYVSKPGRKIGLVLEDMVWQNIYPTDETDIETLEDTYLDKSEYSRENDEMKYKVDWLMHEVDREDYRSMLLDLDIEHSTVLEMSENEDDFIEFPNGSYKIALAHSPIQGKGLFATSNIKEGEVIAPARLGDKRTPAGRYTNHGANPNTKMIKLENGDMLLVALEDIGGMTGGELVNEITVDYRQTAKESGGLV